MPSTRNRSRLSDQSSNKFTAGDFEKKDLAPRVKRCKLKAKKAQNDKKISEQFDDEDEGMAKRAYVLILQKLIAFCHCLINFNRQGTKVI